MDTEAIKQQVIDAIVKGKIQATTINIGDRIEHMHKIDKVEAGGIGFQFVTSDAVKVTEDIQAEEVKREDVNPQPKRQPYAAPFPEKNDYNAVREYVEQRKKHDEVFLQYCKTHTRTQLCERLTDEFGWVVDANHYGQNIRRNL